MTGSRGFACADGPLAGVVLLMSDEPESGSVWVAAGSDGTKHRYLFNRNHFEHAPPDPEADARAPQSRRDDSGQDF
jgi:hypothetical protein